MPVRGVRGATIATSNEPDEILQATADLLRAIQAANPGMQLDDLASIMFTTSEDLTAAYPAQAARQLGWTQVPLMCAREIPVPGSLKRCIRVLLHWNTELSPTEIRHVYLGAAAQLRPDLNVAG